MMNAKSLVLLVVAMAFSAAPVIAAEEAPKIEATKPQNGVFLTYTGYMTTVIELKDGQFRYWFDSDAKSESEPTYPLTGKYSTAGNVIRLEHEKVFQKEWTFRSVGGIISLWRPDALKIEADGTPFLRYYPLGLDHFRRGGAGAILVLTGKSAEKAWTDRQFSPGANVRQPLEIEKTKAKEEGGRK